MSSQTFLDILCRRARFFGNTHTQRANLLDLAGAAGSGQGGAEMGYNAGHGIAANVC